MKRLKKRKGGFQLQIGLYGRMKNMDLLIRIPDGIISRKELMQLVIEVQPEFREGQMKRLIEYWIRMSR